MLAPARSRRVVGSFRLRFYPRYPRWGGPWPGVPGVERTFTRRAMDLAWTGIPRTSCLLLRPSATSYPWGSPSHPPAAAAIFSVLDRFKKPWPREGPLTPLWQRPSVKPSRIPVVSATGLEDPIGTGSSKPLRSPSVGTAFALERPFYGPVAGSIGPWQALFALGALG